MFMDVLYEKVDNKWLVNILSFKISGLFKYIRRDCLQKNMKNMFVQVLLKNLISNIDKFTFTTIRAQ